MVIIGCKIEIYDVSLRDGTQSADVSLSINDKLEIVKFLDEIKVEYIELGWPYSNQKDMECFLEANKIKLKHSKISAFCSTKKRGIAAHQDPNLLAVLKSKARVCAMFGKTSEAHIKYQLKMTKKENLDAIAKSIEFLKSKNIKIFYDAEHFFDGFLGNKEYALKCLDTAAKSGADTLVLCDTNGGCLPSEIEDIVKQTKKYLQGKNIFIPLGIHCHNDSGCATANTIAAVKNGVHHIQTTINGVGERCGNADLCQVIPDLLLKMNCKSDFQLNKLKELSNIFYTLANIKPNKNQPYVGKNAFSHKGGIHIDALIKGASYEHINPSLVGNKRYLLLSDLSGGANVVEVAKKFNIHINKNNLCVGQMLNQIKQMEANGYNIGENKAEQRLLIWQYIEKGRSFFEIENWKIISLMQGVKYNECVLKGRINNTVIEVVSSSLEGPVDATFKTMKKLVCTKYKNIEEIKLANYKVMIARDRGAASKIRVYIVFKSKKDEWATIGISENILEASLIAIEKAFNYYLIEEQKTKK